MPPPRRYEFTDEQWILIAPIMPPKKLGGQWNDHRTTLNGMMWILKSGSPWRDLPERYGSWKSVYHRFQRWTDDGTIDKILDRLRLKLDKEGYIDLDVWCVDESNVRGHVAAAGASEVSKKQAQRAKRPCSGLFTRGWGTKVHLVTCGNGLPLAAVLSPGQSHERKSFESAMDAVRPKSRKPMWVMGDNGYSYPRVRRWYEKRGIWGLIPQRSDQLSRDGRRSFSKRAYRGRNVVERCIGWLKTNRRLSTRYEKLATKLAVKRCVWVGFGEVKVHVSVGFSRYW